MKLFLLSCLNWFGSNLPQSSGWSSRQNLSTSFPSCIRLTRKHEWFMHLGLIRIWLQLIHPEQDVCIEAYSGFCTQQAASALSPNGARFLRASIQIHVTHTNDQRKDFLTNAQFQGMIIIQGISHILVWSSWLDNSKHPQSLSSCNFSKLGLIASYKSHNDMEIWFVWPDMVLVCFRNVPLLFSRVHACNQVTMPGPI